jgi:hypothetical protein
MPYYVVAVRAFSHANPSEHGEARTCWIVPRVIAGQLSITPQQQRDRSHALFTVSIANLGNAPAHYTLSAEDDRKVLDITLDQPMAVLDPARTLHTPLSVRAGAPRLTSTLHTLSIRADAPGMAAQEAHVRFIQAPFFPLWIPAAGMLVLLLLFCGFEGFAILIPIAHGVHGYAYPRTPCAISVIRGRLAFPGGVAEEVAVVAAEERLDRRA